MDNLSLGRLGEKIASEYLSREGYKILEMNFQKRWGEIDIVALELGTLVFVEVKTRMMGDFISPEESISYHKMNSLKKSAYFYKGKHPELPEALRIDFIGIEMNNNLKPIRINLIKNITG